MLDLASLSLYTSSSPCSCTHFVPCSFSGCFRDLSLVITLSSVVVVVALVIIVSAASPHSPAHSHPRVPLISPHPPACLYDTPRTLSVCIMHRYVTLWKKNQNVSHHIHTCVIHLVSRPTTVPGTSPRFGASTLVSLHVSVSLPAEQTDTHISQPSTLNQSFAVTPATVHLHHASCIVEARVVHRSPVHDGDVDSVAGVGRW